MRTLILALSLLACGRARAETLSSDAQSAAAANRTQVAAGYQVAVLGGGCFWGMQELLRKLDGVVHTEVGYTGGAKSTAEYEVVSTGQTGHAESVKVVFDPKRVSYDKLLTYYFKIHDPTTQNRQENDTGTQYRSVIFYQTAEQGDIARAVKARLDASHVLKAPVVTQIVPAMPFYRAEEHHQDYLQHNPHGYQCHYERKISF
jgi:methionine-S-sulfoxide reductase